MKYLLIIVVAAIGIAGPAAAQFSTQGFSLRPHLVGAAWSLDEFESDAQGGGGLGVGLAYGFTDLVSIYAEFSGVEIRPEEGDPYALAHGDLGVQFAFGPDHSPLRFLLNIGVNGRVAELDRPGLNVEVSGAGGTLGGGLMVFTSPNFGFEGGLQFTGGELTEVRVNGISWSPKIDASSVRLNVGVFWFPGR